ncbi:enoyl-CoA hydratase/isomerase family protein [Terrirubrum flagellatum]|uniref:enoyl-CoA hydratase/isomerase family protein n=1 Tax=Terrirubrum flagellatum TaxID=2895980 RepID=UPI003CC837DE
MSVELKKQEDEPELLHAVADNVMTITLNRPRTRNALTYAMYEGVASLCAEALNREDVRAIILTGVPRAFAAGTDIAQFRDLRTREDALAYEAKIERVVRQIEDCARPTIAAISGACTGGGAMLAVACDLRIATRDARIGFPIARTLGNCLSVANYARLESLIGAARVKDLVFTARLISGEEAANAGFVSETVDDHATLMARARELALTIAGHAPLTLQATKTALHRLRRRAAEVDGDDLVTACYLSEDFREGIEAFLAKRQPAWRGK